MTDQEYMAQALSLAQKGAGWTSPNPMVGAVIVKDGQVIGQGYHAKCGDLHAERAALAACTQDPAGATMYVTLEPCCHQGRQPPCTEAILEAGIARVVVGSGDPNPKVAGKGLAILRAHGVQVTEHVLEAQCRALNQVFFHYIQTGKPYVVLKYAMTLDGKMAAYTGASQWITGEEARRHVHTQRNRFRSILVGVDTVLPAAAIPCGSSATPTCAPPSPPKWWPPPARCPPAWPPASPSTSSWLPMWRRAAKFSPSPLPKGTSVCPPCWSAWERWRWTASCWKGAPPSTGRRSRQAS